MAAASLITSASNPRLKHVRRLRRRRGVDAVLVEGYRPLRLAVAAGVRVREVFAAPELWFGDGESALIDEARARGARVHQLGAEAFRSIAGRPRPDGLAAIVQRPTTPLARLPLGGDELVVVADGLERPGNLGTLARTACGAGASTLLVTDARTDPFHPEAVQGSVGTIFHLDVAEGDPASALAALRRAAARVVVATPAAELPYWATDLTGPLAIVVGGERYGVGAGWLAAADERLAIPMTGAADSLNVAVAAGVVLFEAARQRAVSRSPRPA